MIDFLMIATRSTKRGVIEIYPKFVIKKSSDLMIRGGDFYAIWVEEKGLWSTDEHDALNIMDRELDKYADEHKESFDANIKVLHMWDAETGMIDNWHKYCQKQMTDMFKMLDEKLIFSNTTPVKKDYASKQLPYPLEPGDYSAYDKLIGTLYSEEERNKIEWSIGAVLSGDSKKIQKFVVLYGSAGTGKSTILNIIQALFEGYYSVFDAKALGSSSNSFALESFKTNPLVAIQHDGDLSRIEDNTRLNSLVSHEMMTVNEKFKSTYANKFKCFLFMGTNKPVKITDAKSGLIRRLIDVTPSGDRVPISEYRRLVAKMEFELGAIAYRCLDVYKQNKGAYDNYIPIKMLGASNDFYNFVIDSYLVFSKENGVTLKAAWEMYKEYCEDAHVNYPFSQSSFREELGNYFRDFKERYIFEDGTRARSYYYNFRTEKFEDNVINNSAVLQQTIEENPYVIDFKKTESIFDNDYSECYAQYGTFKETPTKKWSEVNTKLKDLNTKKLHYIQVPLNHIVIDFDIPDENGKKNFELNLKEASKFPPTYAELSKGGQGIHLHYIYTGDPTKLSSIYSEHIEVKVFNGNSSLRRKLSKCNTLPIANISSGLPMKGDEVINFKELTNEKAIRTLIIKNLNKEYHPGTKPSIDFVYKILEDAYKSKIKYDVTDMRSAIFSFASKSNNQSKYCMDLVGDMKFCSEDAEYIPEIPTEEESSEIAFFDIEVFPNLFLVNWKLRGVDKKINRMINPNSSEITELLRLKLIGFNNRRYDNHILYAKMLGYNNEQLYGLSQKIINNVPNCYFREAYNISYTDVFDFSSKKQSLKKFEIELGIKHQELGLPWDQPVPKELWEKVADYCDDDVRATEAVFEARQSDWLARQILSDVANMTVNDSTNTLTTKIIFGDERNPQSEFNYRNLGETNKTDVKITNVGGVKINDDYSYLNEIGQPVFPGYKFEFGKSTYRGEVVGEGGEVYSEPGMYGNVALLDIASMHPSSIINEQTFGTKYTRRFEEIVQSRLAIKHKDYDKAKTLLDGALNPYLEDKDKVKDLAFALKIAINSVYGLTCTSYINAFKDKRNIDNIVAKRGALFMINLKHVVQARGFKVAHIKTDSIKIPDATPEIIKFVQDYGKIYGYNFEHEATYDKMCLVNDAVYIAKYDSGEWTATGTQFKVPYVYKTLFSKEPIEFKDLCETKSVTGTLYLDFNEELEDVSSYEKELEKLDKKFKEEPENEEYLEEANRLKKQIAKGHNYSFIGKVGLFCPVLNGTGGGILYREKNGKYYAATGTKGYRWLEAEMVETLKKEDTIDRSFYDKMVETAAETVSKYGDLEWFSSDVPYDVKNNGIHPFVV